MRFRRHGHWPGSGHASAILKMGRVGAAPEIERVLRLRMGEEAERFAPITSETSEIFAALVREAFAMLETGLPDLAGEIRSIVHEMLFAQARGGAVTEFDGASHYQFWGLLLLNRGITGRLWPLPKSWRMKPGTRCCSGDRRRTACHQPDTELYPSPLRRDPRPMDGIYHATFVSARMAWAMEGLAESGAGPQGTGEGAGGGGRGPGELRQGDRSLDKHASLSGTGRVVIEAARDWVEGRG